LILIIYNVNVGGDKLRRSIKKRKVILRVSLLISIFLFAAGVGYAKLSSSISITGLVEGSLSRADYKMDSSSDSRLSMTTPIVNTWYSNNLYYYNYTFKIYNNTTEAISSFIATLDFNTSISNVEIWNYEYTIANKRFTINDTLNSLMGDNSADVAFTISSSSPNLSLATVKLQGINPNSYEEFTASQMPVQFTVTNSWGSYYYQYDIKITNKTGKKLTAWSIEIPLPIGTTRTGGWNADFQMNNQTLIISNLSYNGNINKNGSTTIGIQLSTNINNYMPIVSKRFGR
jgi:hypothetical protein